jgi:hypothetical protein
VAANPLVGAGPPQSIPVGGGLKFEGGGMRVSGNEPWVREFHFAIRTDGQPGTGTRTDPWDASTKEKVDALLTPLYVTGAKGRFYWGVGTFYVNPIRPHEVYPVVGLGVEPKVLAPWYFADGWDFIGCGPGRTIFKMPPDTHDFEDLTGTRIMFRWSWVPGQHIRRGSIQDCTIDGDTDNHTAPGPPVNYSCAIDIDADNFILRNVEITRCGGRGQEIFPVILTQGVYPDPDDPTPRGGTILVEGCSAHHHYHSNGGVGMLLNSATPNISILNPPLPEDAPPADTPREGQHWIIRNNHFRDMYITPANIRDCEISGNWIYVGLADYACINLDTGLNRDIRIVNNWLMDAGNPNHHVGCVNMGTIVDIPYNICEDTLIAGNYLQPRPGGVMSGVHLAGATQRTTVVNNWLKRAGTLPPIGLLRDDDIYPGNGIHWWGNGQDPDGAGPLPPNPGGLNPNWHEPIVPNGVIYCWGNRVKDDGTVPYGMEDKVLGPIGATGPITSGDNFYGKAFSGVDCQIGYGWVRSGQGPGKSDPYVSATFFPNGGVRASAEVVMPGAGVVAFDLTRTGPTPISWQLWIPSGQEWMELGPQTLIAENLGSILRFHTGGNVDILIDGAALSADILTPRKGVTGRSGAAWPVASEVPVNTGCDWIKTTGTREVRHVFNDGGTMHYGPIFSTTP